jgi:Protein of unknown function (DUF3443)
VRLVGSGVLAAGAVVLVGLTACGSGGGGSGGTTTTTVTPVNNVQPVIMDYGPSAVVNGKLQSVGGNDVLYTTVTICVPGTATCQSIDHVQVDTGSTGLRLLASQVTLTLPFSTDANKNPIGNCIQYVASYQWGAMASVDIRMAGEVASSVPIQIVQPSNFPAAPASCSAGFPGIQTVADLGANGILGVGNYRQDCGSACASLSANNPGLYFSCPASGCTVAAVAVAAQLQNPVWMFPQDNNGLAIVLPQIGAGGAVSLTGSMIFGIGTQSNNGLGAAQAQALDNFGNFITTYSGVAYPQSYIDSGTPGYFFLDSATTQLPDCSSSGDAAGYYCPNSPVNFAAINTGPNPNGSPIPVSTNVAFTISNGLTLIDSTSIAFNNLGGPQPGSFAWGLAFFFGRTVFIGIEGQNSAAGVGPYWAY